MPFKSQDQWKAMFAKEESGEIPKGTAKKWAKKTKRKFKDLPEKKAFLKGFFNKLSAFQMRPPMNFMPPQHAVPSGGQGDKKVFNTSLMGDFKQVHKVMDAMPTLDMVIKEIEEDPRLSRKEKERRKKELLGDEQAASFLIKENPSLASQALAGLGGGLVSFLALKDFDTIPDFMKAMIVGAGFWGGKKLSDAVLSKDKLVIDKPDPIDQRSVSKWMSVY